MGINDLYISQGAAQIELLQEHLHRKDVTGTLLRAAVEWSAIHVGSGRPFLSLDYKVFGELLPQSWIKHVWQFSQTYGIRLPVYQTQLPTHRVHDVFLMEQFAAAGVTSAPSDASGSAAKRLTRLFSF